MGSACAKHISDSHSPRPAAAAAAAPATAASTQPAPAAQRPSVPAPNPPAAKAMTRIAIVFYSTYGHIFRLAEEIAVGARAVEGVEVDLFQVAETLPEEVLAKMGAVEAKKAFEHIPVIRTEQLADYDGIIFGSATRFGNMSAQMKAFIDTAGGLWYQGALNGKVGSAFTSSAMQHGGQETTIFSFYTFMLHNGMLIAGVPASASKNLGIDSEISGGTPYGASTIAGPMGARQPSENELAIARAQGEHVAKAASALARAK